MEWLTNNLQILATLGSALAVYIFLRMEARKEANQLKDEIKEVKNEIKEMKEEMKDLQREIQQLDSRVARIEGQLVGPYRWEPKVIEREQK